MQTAFSPNARAMLTLHWRWLLAMLITLHLLLIGNLAAGQPKSSEIINGWDIAGEGGAALLALAWIFLVLSSRPAGRVTNVLSAGLLAVLVSFCQDLLDEVVSLPVEAVWGTWAEAGSMLLGMTTITWGLWLWRAEQLVVLGQLQKRERLFRCHASVDRLTQVPDLDYLRRQIALEHKRAAQTNQPFALLLLDLDQFAAVNRQFGQREGDRLLQAVSELLILNLRNNDLLCRYAGDRFAILLPGTGLEQARVIACELQVSVASFAFRSERGERITFSASIGVAAYRDQTQDTLLERATRALLQAKQGSRNLQESVLACP